MARYIDADALTAEFKRLTLGENSLVERIFADGVYAVIDTFPTADVVPKSEVEKCKEINEQLYKEMSERILEERKIERKLVAREIFEEIDKVHKDCTLTVDGRDYFQLTKFEKNIAELKKKYTE